MNNKSGHYLYLKGRQIKAEYHPQIIEAYQNNPFIEAIPPRISQDQLYQLLYSVPRYTGDLSQLDDEERVELVQQIKPNYWQPLVSHFERYRNLYTMIKIGYQSRNPMSPIYQRELSIGLDEILSAGTNAFGENLAGNIQTAQQMADIGLSGMGKSKSYERVLSLIPQVIHHTKYKSDYLACKQVLWLHIECPSNKSVGALCRNFYFAVDKLLGTSYYDDLAEKDGRAEILAKRMSKVAGQINLGVLVIDEIQRIHKGHSGGEDKMIDFITELTNSIGIPIVMIGTFKALYLFKNSLANTRRGIPDGYAENITDRMKDGLEWELFIQGLWDLQYTKTFTPLTPELKAAMYYHTLGIPDFAVKLFMHIQCHSILYEERESITMEMLERVASKTFRLVQPIFERIRGGEDIDPAEYEDLKPDWIAFKKYIMDAQHRITIDGELSEEHKLILIQHNRKALIEQLCAFAMKMGTASEKALVFAEQIELDNRNVHVDIELLYSLIAEKVLANKESATEVQIEPTIQERSRRTRSKANNPLEPDDIRFISYEANKQKITTDESLRLAGLVAEYDEFV
ncbi:ATP-binding protein [Paenibacillus xylanilyticus]|uniref:ATP-binding protein n=1 Tax=Paenibacillus xylanilyticus TaxID=248903 RepID=A0A7Y6ET83_9BACL|nr:ATP-binding protein [Paenibacillus xylanilyticus]NUU74306.1 ATP-binding protein [Paenibacillus xylanilyticus]